MAPDSVGDGDRSGGLYPRRRRRLVKSGCRVNPSSPKQELSGSSEGEKRKEGRKDTYGKKRKRKEKHAYGKKNKRKEKVMKDDYAQLSTDGMILMSSSSDEDDDVYYRTMTPAEIKIYNQQIRETGGFDVDAPPEVDDLGIIHPDPDFDKKPRKFEEVKRCSRKAIDVYNEKHIANYEFMRVLKVGTMFIVGRVHYITFEAKAEGAAPVCFQAIVYAGITEDDIDVTLSRPKPKS